ncbi:hypothetical protein Tco_0664130 [Tanacetum coccineum]
MDSIQEDTHAEQPQDQKEERIQKLPNARWFTKKSGSAEAAKRKPNWFDMLLKSNIDQVEDHILGLSTVTVAKKIKELIKKDELTVADLEGVGLEMLKRQYKNDPRSFDKQMSKSTKPHNCFYNNDFYYLVNLSMGEKYTTSLTKHFAARYHTEGIEDMIPNRWSKKTHLYQIDALNGILHLEDARKDFFKAEMGNRSSDKVYSDKRIICVVKVDVKRKWGYGFLTSIVVRISDKKEYEFILNDVEDMYLLKTSSLQLGVESYQRTLNLTKPKFYFSRIDQKIPYTTLGIEKGVVYVNQHNMKSLMNLNEVNKFCDDTLLKVRENLLKMVNENVLGHGNKSMNGRDWSKNDIKRSNEMLEKIDKTLKGMEQLRRLEEYVGERPKRFDPHTFVRP